MWSPLRARSRAPFSLIACIAPLLNPGALLGLTTQGLVARFDLNGDLRNAVDPSTFFTGSNLVFSPSRSTGSGTCLQLRPPVPMVGTANAPRPFLSEQRHWSFSAWVRHEGTALGRRAAIYSEGIPQLTLMIGLNLGHPEVMTYSDYVANPAQRLTTLRADATVPAGKWTHLAVTFEATNELSGTARLFLDGSPVSAGSLVVERVRASTHHAIALGENVGFHTIPGQVSIPWEGAIDDVQIHQRALAPYEIGEMASATHSPAPARQIITSYRGPIIETPNGPVRAGSVRDFHDANSPGITLEALPDPGYGFVRWIGDIVSTNTSIRFPGTSNVLVTAEFGVIAPAHCPFGDIVVEPALSVYPTNSAVTVTARPAPGFEFVAWSDGQTQAGRPLVVERARQITAIVRRLPTPALDWTWAELGASAPGLPGRGLTPLAIDGIGNLYCADPASAEVHRISVHGVVSPLFPQASPVPPIGIAADPGGDVWLNATDAVVPVRFPEDDLAEFFRARFLPLGTLDLLGLPAPGPNARIASLTVRSNRLAFVWYNPNGDPLNRVLEFKAVNQRWQAIDRTPANASSSNQVLAVAYGSDDRIVALRIGPGRLVVEPLDPLPGDRFSSLNVFRAGMPPVPGDWFGHAHDGSILVIRDDEASPNGTGQGLTDVSILDAHGNPSLLHRGPQKLRSVASGPDGSVFAILEDHPRRIVLVEQPVRAPYVQLTVTPPGFEGTISVEPGLFVRSGTKVNVRVVEHPTSDLWFERWEGSLRIDTNPAEFILTNNHQIHAIFSTVLSLTARHGRIDVEPPLPRQVLGTTVQLRFSPDPGRTFEAWSDGDTRLVRPFVVSRPASLVARTDLELLLTHATESAATAPFVHFEIDPDLPWYPRGTEVRIRAFPHPGYGVLEWVGTPVKGNPELRITVEHDTHVLARIGATFTATVDYGNLVLVPDQPLYPIGSTVSVERSDPIADPFDLRWPDGIYGRRREFVITGPLQIQAESQNPLRVHPSRPLADPVAGSEQPGFADGPGPAARFGFIAGLALAPDRSLWAADADHHRLRRIRPDGSVETIAGSGTQGTRDGTGAAADFYGPHEIVIDRQGIGWVIDGPLLRRVSPTGTVTTIADLRTLIPSAAASLAPSRRPPFSNLAVGSANRFAFVYQPPAVDFSLPPSQIWEVLIDGSTAVGRPVDATGSFAGTGFDADNRQYALIKVGTAVPGGTLPVFTWIRLSPFRENLGEVLGSTEPPGSFQAIKHPSSQDGSIHVLVPDYETTPETTRVYRKHPGRHAELIWHGPPAFRTFTVDPLGALYVVPIDTLENPNGTSTTSSSRVVRLTPIPPAGAPGLSISADGNELLIEASGELPGPLEASENLSQWTEIRPTAAPESTKERPRFRLEITGARLFLRIRPPAANQRP